jgi:DNA polymerase-3 subunit epsilon
VAGIFYDAHRALTDSEVLLDIMTKQGPDGRPILAHILEKAREPNFTVWAIKSDFETKDALKAAGYRWSDGTVPGRPKAWYKETDDVDAELDFLATKIYSRNQMIEVDMVTPLDRYSTRHTERTQMEVRVGARPKP